MTTTHTPGPWIVSGKIGLQIAIASVAMEGLKLNVAHAAGIRNGEGNANARLIAAAPDLLAALKSMLREHDALQLAERRTGDRWPAATLARAAIAKATGEA